MNTRKFSIVASTVLWTLAVASCGITSCGVSPRVEIDVNPKEVSSGGFVEVTWKTQDFTTTTLSSNPALSGLPKTMSRDSSGVDRFQVTTTTTFQLKGQTGEQSRIASATVTVGPSH